MSIGFGPVTLLIIIIILWFRVTLYYEYFKFNIINIVDSIIEYTIFTVLIYCVQ